LPHLYDPFYSTKPKGVGLGLTLVKRIIEAHGGRLTFRISKGAGTTFMIELPAKLP